MASIWRRLAGGWRTTATSRRSPERQRSALRLERLEDRRLLAAGTLDPSFGDGGRVATAFTGSLDNVAQAVAVQPDSRLVVAGAVQRADGQYEPNLARYNADGSVDAAFFEGGRLTLCQAAAQTCEVREVHDLVVQPDGRIVAAGFRSTSVSGSEVRRAVLLRFRADGSLDAGFGDGGLRTSFIGELNSVVLQADGKIVVAGTARESTQSMFAVARFNANGTPDAGFGTDGVVFTRIDPANPNTTDSAHDAVIQPDGKIVVAGTGGGLEERRTTRAALVRHHADGSLDAGFGNAGRATTKFSSDLVVWASGAGVVLRPDGSLLLVGTHHLPDYSSSAVSNSLAYATLSIAGSLIAPATVTGMHIKVSRVAAGPGGEVFVAASSTLVRLPSAGVSQATAYTGIFELVGSLGLEVQADGKPVVAGWSMGAAGSRDLCLARYVAGTSLESDASLGNGGRVVTDFTGTVPSEAQAAAVQPDGKIVAVGKAGADFAVARYLPSGALDTSFGHAGRVATDFGSTLDVANVVVIQPDGKIVVAGVADSTVALARYDPDGSLDPTFGSGGKARSQLSYAQTVGSLLLQRDGKFVVARQAPGGTTRGAQLSPSLVLARYNSDGSEDSSYQLTYHIGYTHDSAGLGLLPDGRIMAVAPASGNVQLVRTYANGTLDPSLGAGGILTYRSADLDIVQVLRSVQFPDLRWYLGYTAGSPGEGLFGLVRVLPNGNRDVTFGVNGRTVVQPVGNTQRTAAVLVQSDGRIVVVGSSVTTTGAATQTNIVLARFVPAGALDTTFGSDGLCGAVAPDSTVTGATLQADDKVVVVGGGSAFRLFRFLGDDRIGDANVRFVNQVYLDLLQRQPDPAGQASFVAYLNQGRSRGLVAQAITASAEYRSLLVRHLYSQFLGRDADPTGLSAYTVFLGAGGTVEQVRAALLGSDEYFQNRGGGTDGGFVSALYRDVLNRAGDPAGQQNFTQALAAGVPRGGLATALLQSTEARQGLVDSWYRQYLRRAADPGGLEAFVAALQAGFREEIVISVLVGSDEYFGRL